MQKASSKASLMNRKFIDIGLGLKIDQIRRKFMITPKFYTDNINNKIITEEMLEQCLYSVNKRAKNHRDRDRCIGMIGMEQQTMSMN